MNHGFALGHFSGINTMHRTQHPIKQWNAHHSRHQLILWEYWRNGRIFHISYTPVAREQALHAQEWTGPLTYGETRLALQDRLKFSWPPTSVAANFFAAMNTPVCRELLDTNMFITNKIR